MPSEEDPAWEDPNDEANRRMGLWMTVLAWLMIILVITFLFQGTLNKKKVSEEKKDPIKATQKSKFNGKSTAL